MSKKENFVKFVEALVEKHGLEVVIDGVNNTEALSYLECLKNTQEKEKVAFTDNGKAILTFMQTDSEKLFKAKDIAEGLFVSSRSVSGAIRKLITDGYVEKIGESPSSYTLTETGKNVSFDA